MKPDRRVIELTGSAGASMLFCVGAVAPLGQ